MRIDDVVISDSARLTVVHRSLFGLVTVAAWGVFAWLMQPALTLAVWIVSGYVAYEQVGVRLGGIEPAVVLSIGLVAMACAGTLVAWAEYNRRRFAHSSHRTHRPEAAPMAMATETGMEPSTFSALTTARILAVDFDETGAPECVHVLRSPNQAPLPEVGESDGRATP